jgi:hypothetical protein
MPAVKVSLTMRQIFNLHSAISKMKEGGVSAKGTKAIDLGINKFMLEPIVVAFEKEKTAPQEINDYNRKLAGCKDATEVKALQNQYDKDIMAWDNQVRELNNVLDGVREVEIIKVPKAELVIKDDNGGAADVISGLYPCLE